MRGGLMRCWLGMLVLSSFAIEGCFLIAAGAGAGAAIAYTNRGATSTVDGSINEVFDRSATAFQQMGIAETGRGTTESGAKRSLVGTKADLEVNVELTRATDATTKVEVYAKKNTVDYDKDVAREVLDRIIARR